MRPPPARTSRAAAAALALAAGAAGAAEGPSTAVQDREARVVVKAAGPQYRAGWLRRLFFGDDYRDLWTLPVRIEVLDLAAFAGGLEPVRRVGSGQSTGLALAGADGRSYTFRGIAKDATRGLPPELRRTIAGRIAQDQVASMHPAAGVAASALLAAAGVLHVEPRLVVLPDDERLGAFRAQFAGALGTIQEYPRAGAGGAPGFAGATEILGGRELLARLRATSSERVDARAYLRARLVDLLLGDWDRHLGQWRWARLPGRDGWQPIPEDRDFAFCRIEGIVPTLARNWSPRWVSFDDDYPGMLGLTWQAWPLDRELLAGLDAAAWAEVARDLQARLGDEVIDAAVARLPEEYRRADGARLASALRRRRDRLPDAASRFYRHLAEEVSIAGTDEPDRATATAVGDGDLEIAVSRASDGAPEEPWFRRVFRAGETREVRLDLRGGDDAFVARGRSRVRVRVVGGDGDDLLDDSAAGGARLAAAGGRDRVLRGPGTKVDRRPHAPPPPESEEPWLPARDWGRQRTWLPWFSASPELGAFVGAGVRLDRFGFRTHPYARRHVLHAGYATGADGFRAHYHGELRRQGWRAFATVEARGSQIEILRFYGFGNETPELGSASFHEVRQTELSLGPLVNLPLAAGAVLSFGPTVEHRSMRRRQGGFIEAVRPYGFGSFGQLGAVVGLELDTRDVPSAASRGVALSAAARVHPALWDVEEPFGAVRAEVSTYLTAPFRPRPTLALRAGGERVLGRYPFHAAAFVGGPDSLRGFSTERFAGDAAAHGSAEVRLPLGRFFLLLPGEYGVFALADAGRVWLDGERSGRWHAAAGGGIWLAWLKRGNAVTLAAARGDEGTGLYVRVGFAY